MPTTSYTDFTAAVRGIGSRTTAAGAAANDYSAEEDRLAQAILTEGAVTANAFKVNASSGMTVTVGSGAAKTDLYAIQGEAAGQGVYLARLEAATVNVTVPAADAGTARVDEVYLIVADATYDAGSVSLPRLGYRKGDAGGAAPGPDASWKASVRLASIAVGAAVSSITAGNITDTRTAAAVSLVSNVVDAKGDLLAGSAADTLIRLPVGAAGSVLTPSAAAASGLAWAVLPGTLLAATYYDPGSVVVKTEAGVTFVAADTTNLRATFTAPASGIVIARFGVNSFNSGGAAMLGLLSGSTVVAAAQGVRDGFSTISKKISALTPGASYSFDLAYCTNGTGSTILQYGGGLSSAGYGPAFVEVVAGL